MKVLVVPTAGVSSMSVAAESRATVQEALQQRRVALETYATHLTKSARALGERRVFAGASGASAAGEPGLFVAVDDAPFILEGIGALVLDESLLDRRALESSGEAVVFDNVFVPLIDAALDARVSPSVVDVWHLQDIGVDAARHQGLTGAAVLVGVLDTGIDAGHPEFAGKTVHFAEFDQDGRQISSEARDAGDHGTHVAGLIAGRTCGVAPDADLAMAAVLTLKDWQGRLGGSLVQIASGLNWLLTHNFRGAEADPGCDLLNASLGSSPYRDYLYRALGDARRVTGTVMVAAIGNSGELGIDHHSSPGNYDVTIGVGAVDRSGAVAAFSDWGTVTHHPGLAKPDLCAPGVAVTSSVPNGNYAAMTGTSMATPIVTGSAALLLQKDPNYSLDAPRLVADLLRLVQPPSTPRMGRGRLHLQAI